jgi:hypothetical protein
VQPLWRGYVIASVFNTTHMKAFILCKSILFTVLVMIISPAWGQSSEVRTLKTFKGIKVGQAISVYLEQGEQPSVRIETKGISPSEVVTEISGNVLKIHVPGGYRNASVKVYVRFTQLESVQASAASSVFSNSLLTAREFDIQASSAANVEIKLEAAQVRVSASSSGDVELSGKADQVIISASSAGVVSAYGLVARTAELKASSGGEIKMQVTDALVAHASSGGSIRYRGSPGKSNTTSSSGGSVKKSN